jgi:hypothetical protein
VLRRPCCSLIKTIYATPLHLLDTLNATDCGLIYSYIPCSSYFTSRCLSVVGEFLNDLGIFSSA